MKIILMFFLLIGCVPKWSKDCEWYQSGKLLVCCNSFIINQCGINLRQCNTGASYYCMQNVEMLGQMVMQENLYRKDGKNEKAFKKSN